jgi:hypothetical protein
MKKFISLIIFGLVMISGLTVTGAFVEPDNPQYTVQAELTGYEATAVTSIVQPDNPQYTVQAELTGYEATAVNSIETDVFANDEIFQYADIPAEDFPDLPEEPQNTNLWGLLSGYWAELLLSIMALIKIIVRITPTIKDDKVFGWLDKLIEYIIPNFERK